MRPLKNGAERKDALLRLYIVRHATALDRDEAVPDFERSLVKKGEKEAVAVARFLAARHAPPGLVISSFANRAIETAHLFAKAFGYPRQNILLREAFYGSTNIEDLAAEIRRQPDKHPSLMVVGHDPALSRLAAHLVKDFQEVIPKAGVVVAEFPVKRWRDVTGGSGRLLEFTTPARLQEQIRQARSDLESRLARSMEAVLARVNRAGVRAYRDEILKSARRTAKGFMKALKGRPPQSAGPPGRASR